MNAFEFGCLFASISDVSMKKLEKSSPIVWLQLQINFCKMYSQSNGHPFQKQAKKDLRMYKGKFNKLLVKEKI